MWSRTAARQLSHAVVQARGQARPPVWNKAYNALVGLYFAEPTPEVNNAFVAALGDDPISARLARPSIATQQLAGNIWFYYGSRYGEYLGATKLGNPEDFLPAILEESPVSPSGYLTVADYYAGAGDTQRAIADYNHALELSPNRPDVYDSLAVAYFKQGDRAPRWRNGNRRLRRSPRSSTARACRKVSGPTLDAPAISLLPATCLTNSSPTSTPSSAPIFVATATTVRTRCCTRFTRLPATVPRPRHGCSIFPPSRTIRRPFSPTSPTRPGFRLRSAPRSTSAFLNRKRTQPANSPVWSDSTPSRISARGRCAGCSIWSARNSMRLRRQRLQRCREETRDAQAATLVPLDLQVAAQLGTLDSKLTAYRTEPEKAPAAEILRTAARQLFETGDKQSARKILELVFAREIEEHQLVAANFLGLAEIRLASGDIAGALDLLHRLVVAVGNPFENLDPAAALLEKTGHNAEAIEFLDQLVKSAPWDASYRLRLAKAKLAAGQDAGCRTGISRSDRRRAQYFLRLCGIKCRGRARWTAALRSGQRRTKLAGWRTPAKSLRRSRQVLFLHGPHQGCPECG